MKELNFKQKIYNTTIEMPSLTFRQNEKIALPTHIKANYTDGSTQSLPVIWIEEELKTVGHEKGEYTVSGKVCACEYTNPFIEQRADPYAFKGPDGYYYFTASYPAFQNVDSGYDRIILRRSATVKGLAAAEETTIWKAHENGNMAKHIWAPEIHYIKNKWYVFFAAGDKENVWNIRPYVLMCEDKDPVNGKWTECGIMKGIDGDSKSFHSFSLDMTYFENNGIHYLIWAEKEEDSSLFMATINPEKPWQLTCKPILLTKPQYEWEKIRFKVNEGASVLKTSDKVFVFFSASGTGPEYCIGVIYADKESDLMDINSWYKITYPVLQTEDLTNETGPGHNSFVEDENGNLLLVYHARPTSHFTKECGCYCDEMPVSYTHLTLPTMAVV